MKENEKIKYDINIEESNLKILREPQKRSHIKLERKKHKSINEITKEILSIYKYGIRSIFDTPEPKENEVCLIMVFNKNERFLKLYKPIMDIFGSALIRPEFELSRINLNGISNNKKGKEYEGISFEDFSFILKEILSEINKSNENLIDLVLIIFFIMKILFLFFAVSYIILLD